MNTKVELRKLFRSKRFAVNDTQNRAEKAMLNLCSMRQFNSAREILLYSNVGSELSTSPLFTSKCMNEKKVLLPVTLDLTGEMGVGLWNDNLTAGNYGIPEPLPLENYQIETIDIVIVPGIAFDESGGRIGQGKGYYDRFLSQTKALRIGYCYEEQLTESVPMDEHDLYMDYIVTESRVIKCSG